MQEHSHVSPVTSRLPAQQFRNWSGVAALPVSSEIEAVSSRFPSSYLVG